MVAHSTWRSSLHARRDRRKGPRRRPNKDAPATARSRLWPRLAVSPGALLGGGSPAAPPTMEEHLGWPVWRLKRNHYNLRGGVIRAPGEHAPATARSRLWSRLAVSPGALVVGDSPAAPPTMQEHLGWPVWRLQRNHYNLRGGVIRAPGALAPATARSRLWSRLEGLEAFLCCPLSWYVFLACWGTSTVVLVQFVSSCTVVRI